MSEELLTNNARVQNVKEEVFLATMDDIADIKLDSRRLIK